MPVNGVLQAGPYTIRFDEKGEAIWPARPMTEWTEDELATRECWFSWALVKDGYVLEDPRHRELVDEAAVTLLRKARDHGLALDNPALAERLEYGEVVRGIDQLIYMACDSLKKAGIQKPLQPLAWSICERSEAYEKKLGGIDKPGRTAAARATANYTMTCAYTLESNEAKKSEIRQRLVRRGLIRPKGP